MRNNKRNALEKFSLSLLILILMPLLGTCSIEKMAVQKVADMLSTGGGTVFTGEDDPELVGDALPFALKLYESILQVAPDNRGLLLTTGQGFILYAYAYVQMPVEMLPEQEFENQREGLSRAKKLYLRGRGYVLKAMDLRYPGFSESLFSEQWDGVLKQMDVEDVPYLYWAGMGWLGALTTDLFDMELLITMPRAVALITRILDLDETFDNGAVHEFLVTYFGSIPKGTGGSEEKARFHFNRAVELSGGKKASTFLALATTVSVANQDVAEFKGLLGKALAIDVNAEPQYRLMNILVQKRAKWLLKHLDNYFLVVEEK